MSDTPLRVEASVRGWDIYAGGFVLAVALQILGFGWPWRTWAPPLAAVAVWYLIAGRTAMRGGRPRVEVVYLAGMAALIVWGSALNPWFSPVQVLALPMAWWVYLPDRRRGMTWAVVMVLSNFAGLQLYHAGGRWVAGDPTDPPVRLVSVWGFWALVLLLNWFLGTWLDRFFHWGRDRLSLVDQLRQSQAQALALERDAAIAGERMRLSQEVHDTLAQDIAGVRMLVEQARRQEAARSRPAGQSRAGEDPERPESASDEDGEFPECLPPEGPAPPGTVCETLALIAEAMDSVLAATRDLIAATVPVPANSTFKETVLRITARFARETGIPVDTTVTDERLPRVAEVVFVRCLQEGLSNVRKHAHATRVRIDVVVLDGHVGLTLADNGIGLATDAPEGVGLLGMAERVRQAGGGFALESPGPNLGVTMRVSMPRSPGTPTDEVTQ